MRQSITISIAEFRELRRLAQDGQLVRAAADAWKAVNGTDLRDELAMIAASRDGFVEWARALSEEAVASATRPAP